MPLAQQVFTGGTLNNIDTVRYVHVNLIGDSVDNARFNQEQVMPEAGTWQFFAVHLDQAPPVGTNWVFTLHVNGANSALACTVIGGTTTALATGSVATNAGDLVVVQISRTGIATTGNGIHAGWSLGFASTSGRACWMGTDGTTPPIFAGTRYGPLGGRGGSANNATVGPASRYWATDGTLDSIYIDLITAPGVGNRRDFTVYRNSGAVGSTLQISGAATTGNMTGLAIPMAALDLWALQQTEVGAPANSGVRYACGYDAGSHWNVSGESGNKTSGQYTSLESEASTATENDRGQGAGGYKLSGFYYNLSVAPGGVTSRTATLRKAQASTALTVLISGAAVDGSAGASAIFDLALFDYADMLWQSSGAPAGSQERWCFVAGPPTSGIRMPLMGIGP